MNDALCSIAALERDPRAMPFIPQRTVTLPNGSKVFLPVVTRELLQSAGTEALFLVAEMLGIDEREDAETKSALIDLILTKANSGEPMPEEIKPPMAVPRPPTAREKQHQRALTRNVKAQIKTLRYMRN